MATPCKYIMNILMKCIFRLNYLLARSLLCRFFFFRTNSLITFIDSFLVRQIVFKIELRKSLIVSYILKHRVIYQQTLCVRFQEFKFLRKIYPSKGHRRTDSGNFKAEMSKTGQIVYFVAFWRNMCVIDFVLHLVRFLFSIWIWCNSI